MRKFVAQAAKRNGRNTQKAGNNRQWNGVFEVRILVSEADQSFPGRACKQVQFPLRFQGKFPFHYFVSERIQIGMFPHQAAEFSYGNSRHNCILQTGKRLKAFCFRSAHKVWRNNCRGKKKACGNLFEFRRDGKRMENTVEQKIFERIRFSFFRDEVVSQKSFDRAFFKYKADRRIPDGVIRVKGGG